MRCTQHSTRSKAPAQASSLNDLKVVQVGGEEGRACSGEVLAERERGSKNPVGAVMPLSVLASAQLSNTVRNKVR